MVRQKRQYRLVYFKIVTGLNKTYWTNSGDFVLPYVVNWLNVINTGRTEYSSLVCEKNNIRDVPVCVALKTMSQQFHAVLL